ncbi:helix-turn-helix transcriptional regulator [Hydrogenophaga sp.]|uniref:helix-turn-helix domain-containing protein n=1 Tax=Hydrogenophaga sp. TaxID=1904254 RepID=UPI00271FBF7F|nr:helix-turn-helix transcriptional regulator [Hydrogenophaga sp.]MDO9434278.1 helix-turn-helix transcriptional regulator [Hydrogenophaga sp.]
MDDFLKLTYIMDKINNAADLGRELKALRKRLGIRSVNLARDSGRSRDVLHRLERGDDVYVSSLLDALRGLGYAIRLEKMGLPTLQEMQAFAERELGGIDER